MKRIILALLLLTTVFTSCTKEELEKKKINVTVDFSQASGHEIVTFVGDDGQDSYIFDSNNGLVQTHKLLNLGTYTIYWQIVSVPQVTSCQVFLFYTPGSQLSLPEAPGNAAVAGVTLESEYDFSINCR